MFAVLRAARKSIGKLTIALSFTVLAACDPSAMQMGGGGPSVDPNAPVQVALLVPYESHAGDVAVAKSLENAARMAVSDLQRAKIDLRVYPTGGQAERAAAVAKQAVNDGAKIILGPVYGGAAKLAGVTTASSSVNVLSFSNNPEVAGGNVFILGPTFDNTANRLVSYAKSQGKKRILVVNGDGMAENMGAEAIKGAIARQGATIAGQKSFELSQTGVSAAVPAIASAVRSTGADAVFFTSGNDGAMPLLAQMLPENGIKSPNPQFIGLQRLNVPPSAMSMPGLQTSWFALPDQRLSQSFASRYAAKYGSQPHALAGLAYDGVAAIGALLETGRSNALTGNALTRRNGFVGVNGVFRLLPDGTNQRGLSVVTIQNNQVVEIDPAPRAFGGAGF